jgi:hypothetical protein
MFESAQDWESLRIIDFGDSLKNCENLLNKKSLFAPNVTDPLVTADIVDCGHIFYSLYNYFWLKLVRASDRKSSTQKEISLRYRDRLQ